jgi:hypothetical protein
MIISEHQVMKLMSLCRSYACLCAKYDLYEIHDECKNLHREIENQQSKELKTVE